MSNRPKVHRQSENTDQKPLHRMSLDEIVKNVISAESGKILQNPASSSSPASYFRGKKTMDEVWSNMVEQEHSAQPLMAIDPMVMVSHSQQADWMALPLQMQTQMLGGFQGMCPDLSVCKSVSEMCYSEKSLPLGISLPMSCSSESQAEAGVMERKRRYSDEMLEKSIERRQKRMIKNRESAARSRARKQEYTKSMEERKNRLEQTNMWLKKIKEVEAKFKELTPKYQLRRTSSATF